MVALMLLDLKKKFSRTESIIALVAFALLFAIAFSTIARTFVLSFAVVLAVYFALKIFVEKKKTVIPIALVVVTLGVVLLAMFPYTQVHFSRFENEHIIATTTGQENMQERLFLDSDSGSGRVGIWESNLRDWLSNPFTILFGRGIDHPHIDGVTQHNALIFILNKTGLFGLMLFTLFTVSVLVTLYKLKRVKFQFIPFLALVALLSIGMFESILPRVVFFFIAGFFTLAHDD